MIASYLFIKEYYFITYSFRLTSKPVMKSLASFEIASKASSSRSQSARVMLAKVSASLSPMNGDKPVNLIVLIIRDIPYSLFLKTSSIYILIYSQDVADDTDAPHVRFGPYWLVIYNFRRNELRGAEENSDRCIGFERLRQAKIDQLYLMGRSCPAHYVFWLKRGIYFKF